MKTVVSLIVSGLLLLLVVACTEKPPSQDPASGESAKADGDRKVLYWKSTMDPAFIAQSPGKDGMGMDLVPVYAGEASTEAPGTVRIDAATIQNIGVKTALVTKKALTHEIRTVGRVGYDETTVRRISLKVGGWIESQHVNFTGQVVKRGEPLLDIYSPQLVATQEEYLVALRYRGKLKASTLPDEIAGSEELVRSAEARLRYWNITDKQIDKLRERGEISRTMTLYAPFDGIVMERNVPEGGFLQPGQTVYAVADISTVWVYASVYEYEAPWVRVGQRATMTLAYDPTVTYSAKVEYVYPALDKKTRTVEVRLRVPNTPAFELKPDMWANVTLHGDMARDATVVPIQAVIRTGQRDLVIAALGDGRFEARGIQLGAQSGDEFEVRSGLAVGERIVTSAQFLINSESNLQAAISKLIGTSGVDAPGQVDAQPANAMPSMSQPSAEASSADHSQHAHE
ncbi:MAG: efflux RND transporter periplasmic adaptor subunit [Gammaproteobacteria bacterium]